MPTPPPALGSLHLSQGGGLLAKPEACEADPKASVSNKDSGSSGVVSGRFYSAVFFPVIGST